MTTTRWMWVLLMVSALAVTGCEKKDDAEEGEAAGPQTQQVESMGVSIETPAGWKQEERGKQVALYSGMDGVILELTGESELPGDIEAAAATYVMDPKTVHAAETLPDGGYYWHTDVDFGNMVLPYVTAVKVGSKGVVKCSYQLQEGDDPTTVATACKSMKPL